MADTRTGPAFPGTYYPGYEHAAMRRMVETNMDPGQVHETGAAWLGLADALVEFQAAVGAAVGRGGEHWSGAAGPAARTFLARVGDWMGDTGQAFALTADRMSAQSRAAAGVRAAMPQPVDFSMNDAISRLEHETDPVHLADTIAQINGRFADKQREHARAAEVLTTFAAAMADSGSGIPTVRPVPVMVAATDGEPVGGWAAWVAMPVPVGAPAAAGVGHGTEEVTAPPVIGVD